MKYFRERLTEGISKKRERDRERDMKVEGSFISAVHLSDSIKDQLNTIDEACY